MDQVRLTTLIQCKDNAAYSQQNRRRLKALSFSSHKVLIPQTNLTIKHFVFSRSSAKDTIGAYKNLKQYSFFPGISLHDPRISTIPPRRRACSCNLGVDLSSRNIDRHSQPSEVPKWTQCTSPPEPTPLRQTFQTAKS